MPSKEVHPDRYYGKQLGSFKKLFAAAVRIDPQTRYLRRAANCALAAEQPKTAVEYARKAQTLSPDDPSAARLLAAAFRAAGSSPIPRKSS